MNDDPIRKGDLVMLTGACCRRGHDTVGWIGECLEVVPTTPSFCKACKVVIEGPHARLFINGRKCLAPLWWLKKIRPPKLGTSSKTRTPSEVA